MNANSNNEVNRFIMPMKALSVQAAMMPLVRMRSKKISWVTHDMPEHHVKEITVAMIILISILCSRID
jgi:hypothetical protein